MFGPCFVIQYRVLFLVVQKRQLVVLMTCDFRQCDILTSVDSDKPVQPPVKLRDSKLWSVSSLTLK